jgi:DNA primase
MATGPLGQLAWRLWIPITLAGVVVSWTTRAIGTTEARYVSAAPDQEAVNHKTLLYGEDKTGSAIVVVEGPLDVWAIGPGAVAIMGLQTTAEQVERIGRHPLRTICCDNEPAALHRAKRLAKVLRQYPGETYVVELETGKDPAEAERGEIEDIRRKFLAP